MPQRSPFIKLEHDKEDGRTDGRAPEQDRHRNMAEDLVYGRTFCQIEISTILIISSCCHRRKAGGLSLEDEAGDAATVEFNVKLGSRRSRLGRRDVQEERHEAGLAVAPAASHAAYEPQKPPRISISPKLFCKCLREKVILRSDRCPFVCGYLSSVGFRRCSSSKRYEAAGRRSSWRID